MTEARAEQKPTATVLEPLSVSPRETCRLLSIGTTRLYELLGDGELESYSEGSRRRILVRSIHAYIDRRLAANSDRKTQRRLRREAASARLKAEAAS